MNKKPKKNKIIPEKEPKRGRKCKYNKELCEKVEKLLTEKRLKDYQLYDLLGIGKDTFYKWVNPDHNEYKLEFLESINRGREKYWEKIDSRIDDELMKRAFGFTYEEKKTDCTDNSVVIMEKYALGDPSLLKFIATNRYPEIYKDMRDLRSVSHMLVEHKEIEEEELDNKIKELRGILEDGEGKTKRT